MRLLKGLLFIIFVLHASVALAVKTSVDLDSWTIVMTDVAKPACVNDETGRCLEWLAKGTHVKTLGQEAEGLVKVGFYSKDLEGYIAAEDLVKKRYRLACTIYDFNKSEFVYLYMNEPSLSCSGSSCSIDMYFTGEIPMPNTLNMVFNLDAFFLNAANGQRYRKSVHEGLMASSSAYIYHSFRARGHGYGDELVGMVLKLTKCY